MSSIATGLRARGDRTVFRRLAGFVDRLPGPVTAAAAVLLLLVVLALAADLLRPLDETAVDLDSALAAPSVAHPMGTDEVGRDLIARVIHGARVSLMIGAFAALLAAAVGGAVGLAAGTLGGKVDTTIMRFTDACASQSHFFFVLLIAVLFRPALGGAGAVMLAVGLTHWPSLARIVRGELLSVRERPFVAAAIGGGAGRRRLARRHYLPHLVPAIGLAFVLTIPHAIFHEAALSFLGVGLEPHQASLGNLLADSQQALLIGGWWVSLFPDLVLVVAAMTIGTIAEYWREHLHPRWRSELEL
jgi:peptide/nickel transport system permease protein